jgi:hypothetical protein
MGILCFVCPITGNSVSTNLEIDAESFSTLFNNGFCPVECPHCGKPHNLSKLAAWLTEDDPEAAWWTEDDAPVRRRRDSDGTAKLPSGFS